MQAESGAERLREFSVRDFLDFGEQYGIEYRFSANNSGEDNNRTAAIARGCINELTLPSGLRFTHSELDIFHGYESVSLGQAPLLIVIVLEGCINLSVGPVMRELRTGMAASLRLCPEYALQVRQSPDQHLKTLTLAWDPGCSAGVGTEHPVMRRLLQEVHRPMLAWQVPGELFRSLEPSLNLTIPELRKHLVLEGLAMQLLAHGLPEHDQSQPRKPLSYREQQRLESVRQLLEFAPAEHHSLEALADRAAMSSSSLRAKFRATYGVTLFEYLRRCRLELGRNYLERGYSVQQAAHCTGYRHATNFATAYRRHFGVSPRKEA
ncbi:helix-turn-helix transcriptional regulator [Marinobacter persicus]|uniref:AraC-like DNA-binding protein n=1 Tax=Marinobacter persicus TaxID=930118 RepID=A0A2S6G2G2_9GAMM|nr:helix-turn-helix transcriptional regulator [Marinobacter persicus]PPK49958.1 AraC-like DNA-binding protein [Marinobacter persicus]PPK51875.1 AraC-like DNA-binding protein [Marinobacter persicus]PPK56542.1 AraC-like DNA-binding protein [Marinobacter persicus]